MVKFSKSLLIFTGTSGSGKSVLSRRLAQEYGFEVLDIFEYVKPYIEKYGSPKVKGEILKRAYRDLILDLPNLNFDFLEIASDWPDEFIPKIIKKLKKKPILIFCNASLKICLSRNTQKNLPVPQEIVQKQASYGHDFYQDLATKINLELIIINTEGNSSKSYQNLKTALNRITT